jgi:hypothetical protein
LGAGATQLLALGLLGDGRFEHLLASPCETGDGVVAETLGGPPEIALVSALLDFAHDALPILLVRVVALDRGFELEAQAGVANLFASQGPEAPVDVFASRQRLETFDAHEVLFIEGTQSLDAVLELSNEPPDFVCVHGEVYVLSNELSLRRPSLVTFTIPPDPSPTKALLSSPVGTSTTLSDFRRQIDGAAIGQLERLTVTEWSPATAPPP